MSGFLACIRSGLRQLRRQPALSAFTILTLGLGIGCLTAVASAIELLVLRPLPYRDADRLIALQLVHPQQGTSVLHPASALDFLEHEAADLARVAAVLPADLVLERGEEPVSLDAAYASPNIFNLLGLEAALGAAGFAESASDPPGVVLSYRAWRSTFQGDPHIVGRSLLLNGTAATVRGVLRADATAPFPTFDPQVWLTLPADRRAGPGEAWVYLFGRLPADGDQRQAELGLTAAYARLQQGQGEPSEWRLHVVPLRTFLTGNISRTALGLFLGCFILFAAATINAAAFVLAQERAELPATAIKVAFGAPPLRLFTDRLCEKLGPASLAGGVGLAGAAIALSLYERWGAPGMPGRFELGISLPLVAFAGFLTLAAAVSWALLATVRWTRRGVVETLRIGAGPTTTARSRRGHFVLVSLQIALGFALAVAMGLLLESYARLNATDLGFDRHGVLTAVLNPASAANKTPRERGVFYQEMLEAVRSLPGVRSAGLTNYLPFQGESGAMQIAVENPRPELATNPVVVQARTVSPGYLEAMGIALADTRSRHFNRNELWGPSAVVSRRAARWFWGDEAAALGKRIKLAGSERNPWMSIIGVCDDVRHESVNADPQPTIYLPLPLFPTMTMVIRYETSDPRGLFRTVQSELLRLDHQQLTRDVRTIEERVEGSLERERIAAQLMSFIAIVSVLLAISGVAGATWQMAVDRRRELGVRFAMGAKRRDIVRLVRREATPWVGAGYAAGFVASLWFAKLVSSLLFETGPYNLANALAVFVALTLLLGLGFYLPARRASRTDPAAILRE